MIYIIWDLHKLIRVTKFEAKILKDLDKMTPLFEKNIPKLMEKTAFTRKELFEHFSKYKALCHLHALSKKNSDKNFSKFILSFI